MAGTGEGFMVAISPKVLHNLAIQSPGVGSVRAKGLYVTMPGRFGVARVDHLDNVGNSGDTMLPA